VFVEHQRLVHTFETNLRGPAEPVFLGGHKIRAITPAAVNPGNIGVSFDVLSYAGVLGVTVVSDPEIVAEPTTSWRSWRVCSTASLAPERPTGLWDRDDELSSGLSGLQVTHRIWCLVQRVGLVDRRGELAGFDESSETLEVGVVLLRGLHREPLTNEGSESNGPQLAAHPSGPAVAIFAADQDERSGLGRRAAQPWQR
jgi:hypothetical protein